MSLRIVFYPYAYKQGMFILCLCWRILSYVSYGRCIDLPSTTFICVVQHSYKCHVRMFCCLYQIIDALLLRGIFHNFLRHKMSLLQFMPSAFFPHCLSVAVRWESKSPQCVRCLYATRVLIGTAGKAWSLETATFILRHCGSDVFHSLFWCYDPIQQNSTHSGTFTTKIVY